MALLTLPTLLIPKAPNPKTATQADLITWMVGASQALQQFQQGLEAVESYIADNAQLATGIIEADNIVAGTITADLISTTGAIITVAAQIQDAIITDAKIVNLDGIKITADSITAGQIAASAITVIELAASAVTSAGLAASSILATHITPSAITTPSLAASSVVAASIAAGAVTAAKISVAELSAIVANMGTLTAGTINGGRIISGATSGAHVELGTTGIMGYDSGPTQRVQILNDGSGYFGAATAFSWNAAGAVTIDGGRISTSTVTTVQRQDVSSFTLSSAEIGDLGADLITSVVKAHGLSKRPLVTFGTNTGLSSVIWTTNGSDGTNIITRFYNKNTSSVSFGSLTLLFW